MFRRSWARLILSWAKLIGEREDVSRRRKRVERERSQLPLASSRPWWNMATRRPTIIAHHLIWTLYGHWLPNDLRGSGSAELHDEKFAQLGPIYHGRKPAREQPSRKELREFHRQAEPLLNFPRFWIDDAKRQAVGNAISEVVADRKYTVWACAILSNHVHMVIRRHRDDALAMWRAVADASCRTLREFSDVGCNHPVWSTRPYKVFFRTPDEVCGRIAYVISNPEKEGLSAQRYDFVQSYNNWPFHTAQLATR
jgi:REP element-mobilizing transposase RayT